MNIPTTAAPSRPARNRSLFLPAALAGLLLLSACASTPEPPTSELQAAEQAIGAAEQARAGTHAPLELREAREKLAGARSEVQQERMERGQRLAVESRVYAELASARTAEAKAKTVNAEMRTGTQTLEMEMQRNTGAAE